MLLDPPEATPLDLFDPAIAHFQIVLELTYLTNFKPKLNQLIQFICFVYFLHTVCKRMNQKVTVGEVIKL